MKKILPVMLLLTVVLMPSVFAENAMGKVASKSTPHVKSVEGTVANVNGSSLNLKTATGNESFSIDSSKTQVWKGKSKSTLQDIIVGSKVKIRYAGPHQAQSIEIA